MIWGGTDDTTVTSTRNGGTYVRTQLFDDALSLQSISNLLTDQCLSSTLTIIENTGAHVQYRCLSTATSIWKTMSIWARYINIIPRKSHRTFLFKPTQAYTQCLPTLLLHPQLKARLIKSRSPLRRLVKAKCWSRPRTGQWLPSTPTSPIEVIMSSLILPLSDLALLELLRK